MAFGFKAVGAALAIRFGPTVVTPPTGLTPIQSSTHLLPDNVTGLPCTLVFPFRPAEFEYDPQRRNAALIWPVRFFFDLTSLPQRMENLYDWAEVLYDQYPVSTSIDLGLGAYVYYAEVQGIAITTFEYGSVNPDTGRRTEYPIIELPVLTQLGESLS